MNGFLSYFSSHISKSLALFFLLGVVFFLRSGPVGAAEQEESEVQRLERHYVHFSYSPDNALSTTTGGTREAAAHAPPRVTTADQIHTGQANIKKTLGGMRGRPLTVTDTLKVYASAGEGGFHAVHSSHRDGVITPEISRELGLGRQKFHNEVLVELAKTIEPQTKGLGVNDFGSGADPAKINAKGDIDFTLYAKNPDVEAPWLVDQYNRLFKKLARERYGVDLTPDKMDIVAHRYDATIPDWRIRQGMASFEGKLRTGTTLLRENPEAYFLEGAYLQQVMSRSTKEGKKTFTWYIPDESVPGGIRTIRVNAATVPQFFYAPVIQKAHGFGGAVGNYHFHHAHADDFQARAKYILRSLDNGPGLLLTGKRGDYQDIGNDLDGKQDTAGRQERRQIIDNLYDSPQMRYSPDLRDEIFEVYEVCRRTRIAKDKGLVLSESELFGDLMAHMKKHSLIPIDDATALKQAKQTFNSTSELILTSNVIRTTGTRARDWLRPHTVRTRISYEDENGNLVSVVPNKTDLQRLQFAAFREIQDAIRILQQDNKQHVIDQLKKQNPILRRDIEIIEGIIKKQREMMIAPESETPEGVMTFRQQAAQAVIDSWERMGQVAPDSSLWNRSIEGARNLWGTGQALESYLYSNLTQAVIYSGGRQYGPVLEHMRQNTQEINRQIMDPVWMTRISRANSAIRIMTLYVQEGSFNETVIKEAIIEGISHFPLIGMPIDIYRGTVSGLLNYTGGASGLARVTIGSGLGQVVLSQFIPGYGPVILVVNTSKGVVNLGGTIVFTPLKDQRIKLAYQGYLDPVDIEPQSWLYKYFLEKTGTRDIRDTAAWWLHGTGRQDRIYSPRPSVLHPIDPGMKMDLEERRKAVLAYFQPRILALFHQRYGDVADVYRDTYFYSDLESEFLPRIMYKHVHDWWGGRGIFASHDELTVKRMMDEHYSDEIKAKLTQLLISDYIAGKGELIKQENEWWESLKRLYSHIVGYLESYLKTYEEDYPAISEAHNNAGMQVLGLEQEEVEPIKPRLEILYSPTVTLGKNEEGIETSFIEKINIRAKVEASDTEEHPAPFRIGFQIKIPGLDKTLSESDRFSLELAPGAVPESLTVAVIAYDANNRPFVEHEVTIPILEKQAASEYDGGKSLEEVFDRLEELVEKAEEMSREALEEANRAQAHLTRASSELRALGSNKGRIEKSLSEAESYRQQVLGLIPSIENRQSLADRQARELELFVPQACELSREICLSMMEMESEPSRKNELINNIRLKRQRLLSILSSGRKNKNDYVSAVYTVRNQVLEVEQKQEGQSRLIDSSREGLDEGIILDHLIEADMATREAQNKADTIKDLITDAEIEYAQGMSFIELRREKAEKRRLEGRLDKLMERIRKTDETTQHAVSPLEGNLEKVNRALQALSDEILKIKEKRDDLLARWRENEALKEGLTQKNQLLAAGLDQVEDNLTELEYAALDADICAESAQNTAQAVDQNIIRANERCNQITQQLNDARRSGDSRTYGSLLHYYHGCQHYGEALAVYNDMIRTDQRCNELTRQLNEAQQRGDLQTYQALLNSYKDCNHYNQAVANYNALVQNLNLQFCRNLLNQLNEAQSRRDVAAYGSLLNQASRCPYYQQALNIYNGMKNQQNMQALTAFIGGMMQILDEQNRRGPASPPPSPPGPPQPDTGQPPVTTGSVGLSQAECERKFCPVCATGGSVDLLGVSVNQQCMDCRARFKAQIDDCLRGGVSVHRSEADMSGFKTYRVIKCRAPVKDASGRVIRFREFYEFAGPNRAYPQNAECVAIGNGTWEECISLANQYNSRNQTGYYAPVYPSIRR